ncbi:hypothetical protein Acin_0002 [Acidaminococcus intestini RyC-MR95]|uniref:Uncharacterized protein n=1 Tax=Acidaminococcus intestini (strain RyC-MR95) TaxID=568816 RepID=G4Q5F6_ACIIR|nr:hypothetical protein Acin_0002 [Acidaminococcus intestini RyC-MR95]
MDESVYNFFSPKSCGLVDSHQQLSHTFINSEIDGHIKDFRIFEQIHSPYY